jgi:hypothetical protein
MIWTAALELCSARYAEEIQPMGGGHAQLDDLINFYFCEA